MSDVAADPALPGCQQMLQDAIKTYLALLSGPSGQVLKVKSVDNETEWSRRNADDLLGLIRNLNMQCPCAQAEAILGIPRNHGPLGPRFIDRGWQSVPSIRRRSW